MNDTNPLSSSNEWLYSVLNLDGYNEDSNVDFSDETDSTGTSTTTSQSPSTGSNSPGSPLSYQEPDIATIQQATNALMLSGVSQLDNSDSSSIPSSAAELAHQTRIRKRANRKYTPYKTEDRHDSTIQSRAQKRKERNREAAQKSRECRKAELTALRKQNQQLQDLGPKLEELVKQYRQTFPWSTLKPETQIIDPIARIQQIVETMMLEAIANQQFLEESNKA